MKTKNLHLSYYADKILKAWLEIEASASAGTDAVSTKDMARFKVFLADLKADLDYIAPKLDSFEFPKWHPVSIDKPEAPQVQKDVQSPTVMHLLSVLGAHYHEMLESQSSDLVGGLYSADKIRGDEHLTTLEDFLDKVEVTNPLDFPDTASLSEIK